MEEYRQEVVTTTTTEPTPGVRLPPITVNSPWQGETERVQQVTVDPYTARRLGLYRMQQGIWTVFALVEGLIGIRFILRLLGANPDAGFAQVIYGITAPLVAPFVGLFGTPRFEGSAFEFTSLVAIVVYALLGWVIVRIVLMVFSDNRAGSVTRRTETRIQ